MQRDGLTSGEALQQIREAKEDFNARLESGEDLQDFMEETFGLEPDYLEEFL